VKARWPISLIDSFICVVTGAGAEKGVGRSTVFELAAHGVACVYACDMDDSNFDELIAECKEEYPSTEVNSPGMPLS
jgi:NAD(P)-dependent dehydrogenase (short-subunit alcohol dehydrogenase family)